MSTRVVNLALLGVTLALLATGVLLLTTSRAQDAWLYTLHRYTGALLLWLLVPKARIIVRSLARQMRRGSWYNVTTLVSVALAMILAASLAFALAWTLNLLPFYVQLVLYVTPLGWHWYSALALAPLFAWHVVKRWQTLPRRAALLTFEPPRAMVSRREALNLLGVGAAGIVAWGVLEFVAGREGFTRRFSGSREVTSFSGNNFPVTNSDAPPALEVEHWRLGVKGSVARPFELTYAELVALAEHTQAATLDCTLGWASTQNWRGVPVGQLLARAGVDAGARQVDFRAVTGAYATLSLDDARGALIATHVGDEALGAAHGFPARLVAPTRRGYHWIKWMKELVVS